MSRTIRRSAGRNKHGVLLPTHNYWVWPYDSPEEDSYTVWRRKMTPVQAKTWLAARFHRDHRSGQFNVPSWFRNLYTRAERREQRREIYRCMCVDEWDDFLVIDNPDRAGWAWF